MARNLNEILFPNYAEDYEKFKASDNLFAYYTSADTALQILSNESIWMRKPSTMNDYSEIEHGLECFKKAYDSDAGNFLKDTLNSLHNGISEEIDNTFEQSIIGIRNSTYITCFTEHLNNEENDFGRLSMWRAYGKNNGIALILKRELFLNNHSPNLLGVIGSPVAYLTADVVKLRLNEIANSIRGHLDYMRSFSREDLHNWIVHVFTMATICNKHSGFKEEKEWRAITYFPLYRDSPFLEESIKVINGTPQLVQIFHLMKCSRLNIDYSLRNLLHRIIIGPCNHPDVVKEALSSELKKLGFLKPESLIHISNVPLRPS